MAVPIDIDRINRRLDDLWDIGKTSRRGVTRLAYSEDENEAHEYLLGELPNDFSVEIDSIGNILATTDPDSNRSIYLGSHLDTVYNGGRLDGTLGVVVALEAIEATLEADEDFSHPPTLAVFRGEESSRFGHHTIGSRAALGILDVETFASTDQNNVPLWQAIERSGFQPENLDVPSVDVDRISGFFEAHIEQGRVLDDTDKDLGIVTSIRAPIRHKIRISGAYDHSGATPMGMRRDAVACSGEIVLAIEQIAEEQSSRGDIVATVGDIDVIDGAINKVCGETVIYLDIRSADRDFRAQIQELILETINEIADRRNVNIEIEMIDESNPIILEDAMVDFLEIKASEVGNPYMTLPSGGGHDAMNFDHFGIPTGMIFVPSIDGVSHDPAEETDEQAIIAAAELFSLVLQSYDHAQITNRSIL